MDVHQGEQDSTRRALATILIADVCGFSRLMGEDERATLKSLALCRKVFSDHIALHQGRVVESVGDALLATFSSPVEAVACAADTQCELGRTNQKLWSDRRMDFRIGINLGDIIEEANEVQGDAVNVAARLETLAEPGGVCLAANVVDLVRNKLPFDYQDLGPQHLKNIVSPVHAYRLVFGPNGRKSTNADGRTERASSFQVGADLAPVWRTDLRTSREIRRSNGGIEARLPLPDGPSIAVLPFANMSRDPEQEYFSDGITEDIITDLSKLSGLLVIARSSTFQFKDMPIDVREVGERLGVRYVLEGSVRKATDTLRISAQLIDASNGTHVWGERYDRSLEDIFEIQDDVAHKVASAMEVKVTAEEKRGTERRGTAKPEAYDTYLRAINLLAQLRQDEREHAEGLFRDAIALDPEFAGGYAGLSLALSRGVRFGIMQSKKSREKALDEALTNAEKALAFDDRSGRAYIALGEAHLLKGEYDAAIAAAKNAIRLEPSNAEACAYLGFFRYLSGRADEAVKPIETAIRLSPFHPKYFSWDLGVAYLLSGEYGDAIDQFERALRDPGLDPPACAAFLAATYWLAGEKKKNIEKSEEYKEKAKLEAERHNNTESKCTLEIIHGIFPFKDDEVWAWIEKAMADAGVIAA